MTRLQFWPIARRLLPFGVLALFALLPYTNLRISFLFDGPINTPGNLHILAICLVFGGLALGYDLLFGRTNYARGTVAARQTFVYDADEVKANAAAGQTPTADISDIDYLYEAIGTWL